MDTGLQIITLWVLICTALVFFMQAGFCCLESGLSRSKNSINVAIKNVVDLCVAAGLFWLVGYGLMFGDSWPGLFGTNGFLFADSTEVRWTTTVFIFQLVFCGTAITIASGAVAERMHFRCYLVLAALIAGVIYPIFGHWAWGSVTGGESLGWLEWLGFIDFAGSTVVHSVGAWSALAAVIILGARTGRFEPGKPPRKFQGSNLPMAALGVFILWFGWFGFNGGSTLAFDGRVPGILVNTFMAAVSGGLAALVWQTVTKKLIAVECVMNGVLAGLVAVTASRHIVSLAAAIVIGIVAALVMQIGTYVLEHVFRIDDVVGAIPVHGCAGAWGTIAVALFAPISAFPEGTSRLSQLLIQLVGVAVCFVWAFGASWVVLKVLNHLTNMRVSQAHERIGLNVAEHGATTELHGLISTMEHHIQGDFTSRVIVDDFSDAGLIATQYNRVVDAVEAKNHEVEQAHAHLKVAHDDAVDARQELEESVGELTRFNHLAVGRELRMLDLKREVNGLRIKLGQPAPYNVDAAADRKQIDPSKTYRSLSVVASKAKPED